MKELNRQVCVTWCRNKSGREWRRARKSQEIKQAEDLLMQSNRQRAKKGEMYPLFALTRVRFINDVVLLLTPSKLFTALKISTRINLQRMTTAMSDSLEDLTELSHVWFNIHVIIWVVSYSVNNIFEKKCKFLFHFTTLTGVEILLFPRHY